MKLYYAVPSPFARKVRIALIETGLSDSVELVATPASPMTDEGPPLSANPLKKVPCLVRDDAPSIYDSRVICRFIASLRPHADLYPDGNRLWETLTLEATADGMMDAAVLMVYERRVRPEKKRMEEWTEAQWSKIASALAAVERRWMPFLAGPVDMGHLALASALQYLDFRHHERDWRKTHPALQAWEAEIAARPSLQATMPHD